MVFIGLLVMSFAVMSFAVMSVVVMIFATMSASRDRCESFTAW